MASSDRSRAALLSLGLALSLLVLAGCAAPPRPPPQLIVTNTSNGSVNNPAINSSVGANATAGPNATANGSITNAANRSSNQTAPGNGTAPDNHTPGLPVQIQNTTPVMPPVQATYGNATYDPTNGRVRSKSCAVSVQPTSIYAGQEATVYLYAYSASNEQISYLCGDEERVQGYGGLFQDQRVCQFNTPGSIKVWVALDGQTCASAPLEVLDPVLGNSTTPACNLIEDSRSSAPINGLRAYSAKVMLKNYEPNATISWDCGWKKFTRRVGDVIAGNPATGTLILSCQYTFDPGLLDHLAVNVNSDYCGDLIR